MTKETIFFLIVNFPSLKVMFLCHNYTVFTFLSWFVSHAFVLMFLTFCKIIENFYLGLRIMAVSFIGGRNRNAWRKSQNLLQITDKLFHILCCFEYTSP